MRHQLSHQGTAENGQIEALVSLQDVRPSLRILALNGHPGALTAYRYNRCAERYLLAANRALQTHEEAA